MWEKMELLTLALIPAFIVLDLFVRARVYDRPRFWRGYALFVTVVNVGLSMVVATFWARLFGDFSLIDGTGFGIIGGAIVGVFTYELAHYSYHRLAHKSTFLWRASHQMHQSAESLDAFGAYYLHPIDVFFFTTCSSLVFFPLLGVKIEAALLGALFLTFNAMFQHANLRTPRWLGYFIQRPESHALHHGRGHHRSNYADLPVLDMMFGTFENPVRYDGPVGFEKGASGRIGAMLIGRDISGDSSEAAAADLGPDTERTRPVWAGGAE